MAIHGVRSTATGLLLVLALVVSIPGAAAAAALSAEDGKAAVAAAPVPKITGEVHHWRRFQTPSGNIRCAFQNYEGYPVSVRCDIGSGLNPEPSRDCELDWTGTELRRRRRGYPVCAGDTVADPSARVLQYGEKWRRKGLTCVSRERGLTCRSRRDHGFFLSRAAWDVW